MTNIKPVEIDDQTIMHWLPNEVQTYLKHTEEGISIRAIARDMGVHASTILRQVRKTEAQRDDPLVDTLLEQLGEAYRSGNCSSIVQQQATEDAVSPFVLRFLKALMKEGAVLAVSKGVDTAVVLVSKNGADPHAVEKGPTKIVEMMSLRGWITGDNKGRVSRYRISVDGRVMLNKLLAQAEGRAVGFAEAPTAFTGIPNGSGFAGATRTKRRGRNTSPVGTESPVRVLGRGNGRSNPYLSRDLVIAAERFQRDFAVGQFEVSGTPTWEKLSAEAVGVRSTGPTGHPSDRKLDARMRFSRAVRALGPELGEIAIAVCCHEKGMERIEAEMSMPARSGKYMLRVALNYLERHYKDVGGEDHELIY